MCFEKYLSERLLCKNRKFLLCYDKGCIIVRRSDNKNFVQKIRIHSRWYSFFLVERLLRLEPRTAFSLDDETFLFSDHGHIWSYSVKNNSLETEHTFDKGMNNPLTFCLCEDKSNNLHEALYGEYIWNPQKGPVSIYKRSEDGWKEVYAFSPNTITHIHNIVYDEYRNQYIILTGDEDSESVIWQASPDFSRIDYLIGGKQEYRACVAFPTKQGIYYATDTPLEQNWICSIDDNKSLKKIYPMPGPCIFGVIRKKCLYVATSVEGDSTQSKWRYRFSNKLGAGVHDRMIHILKCTEEGEVKELGCFKKDFLPMWLFEFGNAKFPNSDDDEIYICPQSSVSKGTFIVREEI